MYTGKFAINQGIKREQVVTNWICVELAQLPKLRTDLFGFVVMPDGIRRKGSLLRNEKIFVVFKSLNVSKHIS